MMGLKFLKNKIFNISLSSFMVAAIMVILALAQTIISFNAGEVIETEMSKMNQTSLFMEKFSSPEDQEILDAKYYGEVLKTDIEKFQNNGYDGEIYEVLTYSIPIITRQNFTGKQKTVFTNSIYCDETLGSIIVDEEFLTSNFGDLEYLAISDNLNSSGIFITDYVADSILAKNVIYKNKKTEFSRSFLLL